LLKKIEELNIYKLKIYLKMLKTIAITKNAIDISKFKKYRSKFLIA